MPQSIFDVATQYAFAGYSALAPLLVAALFWRRSTKWGALASTLWTAAAVLDRRRRADDGAGTGAGTPKSRCWSIGGVDVDHARDDRHDGVRSVAGRADDDHLGGADGGGFGAHAAIAAADPPRCRNTSSANGVLKL